MTWDQQTDEHFRAWLVRSVPEDERLRTNALIRALAAEFPDLLERLSWPEMRNLAERNATWKRTNE